MKLTSARMRYAQRPQRQPLRRHPVVRHGAHIRRAHDALPQRVKAVVDVMPLQDAIVNLRIRIHILVVAPVQVPDGVQAVHAVKRADQHGEVVLVAGDRDAFIDEPVGLRFRDPHHGFRVQLHPLGVGLVAVAHIFCFLVAEAAAEDLGFVADDVLGGSCGFE